VYAEIQRAFDGADDVAAAAREIADSDSEAFAPPTTSAPAATARDGSDTSDATATDDATTATDDTTTTATDDAATETRTNMIDREAVRNNANANLRNVRPIDPEEIAEYIEGSPHPAVVRETLREEAFDLRLREREDGAFEPVSEEPVRRPAGRRRHCPRTTRSP